MTPTAQKMLATRLNSLIGQERNPEAYVQERRHLLDSVIKASCSSRPSLVALQEQIDHIRAMSGSPAVALKEITRLLGDHVDALSNYVALWCKLPYVETDHDAKTDQSD